MDFDSKCSGNDWKCDESHLIERCHYLTWHIKSILSRNKRFTLQASSIVTVEESDRSFGTMVNGIKEGRKEGADELADILRILRCKCHHHNVTHANRGRAPTIEMILSLPTCLCLSQGKLQAHFGMKGCKSGQPSVESAYQIKGPDLFELLLCDIEEEVG